MLVRVWDVETTGLEEDDAVIEVGWADVKASPDLAGGWADWQVVDTGSQLVHPGRVIPAESSSVHHIIEADVRGMPRLRQVIRACVFGNRWGFFGRPDYFAAHNIEMEQRHLAPRTDLSAPLLGTQPWLCTYKGALHAWPEAPGHSNGTLRYWRNPEGLEREMAMPSHRAGPDAYVTAFLLRDLLNAHPIEKLLAWSTMPALLVTCRLGKYRGMRWADLDDGFLAWCLGPDKDFDEDVRFTCQFHLNERKKERSNG